MEERAGKEEGKACRGASEKKREGGEVACYGVATMSRLLKIIGFFCRIFSL